MFHNLKLSFHVTSLARVLQFQHTLYQNVIFFCKNYLITITRNYQRVTSQTAQSQESTSEREWEREKKKLTRPLVTRTPRISLKSSVRTLQRVESPSRWPCPRDIAPDVNTPYSLFDAAGEKALRECLRCENLNNVLYRTAFPIFFHPELFLSWALVS